MKTAILYQSFLGTTKKYAVWLAEELKADLFPYQEATKNLLNNYQTVIIASGTYFGFMPLIGFLKKYWQILKKKKVIALSVGMSPNNSFRTKFVLSRIPKNISQSIKIIRLPGSFFGLIIKEVGEVKKENLKKVITLIIEPTPKRY
jgi:menaquinone-dependent protoporphyrinogen IX oxidase